MRGDESPRGAEAFDQCLRLMIGAEGLADRAGEVFRARDAVFEGFQADWQRRNMKFDLSMSCGEGVGRAVRFSYNNFGEAPDFERKIARVFSLYPGVYDRDALGRVLETMKPTDERHQTTLGFEWTAGGGPPRIKVYFEELQHRYSLEQRRDFARRLLDIAGAAEEPPRESLAAIAVDFLPGGGLAAKLYSVFRTLDDVVAAIPGISRADFIQRWREACAALSRERKAFYYVTRRRRGRTLLSMKLYKIYEFAQFESDSPAWIEIGEWLGARDAAAARRIQQLRLVSARHGGRLYPVIASVDCAFDGGLKRDLYFSIRPGGQATPSLDLGGAP